MKRFFVAFSMKHRQETLLFQGMVPPPPYPFQHGAMMPGGPGGMPGNPGVSAFFLVHYCHEIGAFEGGAVAEGAIRVQRNRLILVRGPYQPFR